MPGPHASTAATKQLGPGHVLRRALSISIEGIDESMTRGNQREIDRQRAFCALAIRDAFEMQAPRIVPLGLVEVRRRMMV